jgi:hydrocephalus-inducing protein
VVAAAAGAEAVTEVPLEFKIDELGTYKYTLQLKPMPPTSEPTLRFEAPLGASQTETFTFRAFNRSAVSFACSVSQPMFFQVAEPSKAADACADWEGQDVKVQVRFEPEKLGNIDDVLVVDGGAEAGEYRVRLAGVCRRPQPQGPFDVPGGGSKDIAVRNVYATDREYVFTVDNPAFAVGAAKATIKAKDSSNCSVKYTPSDGAAGGVETGKLFVSCPAVPDMPPWIFYLRGVSS